MWITSALHKPDNVHLIIWYLKNEFQKTRKSAQSNHHNTHVWITSALHKPDSVHLIIWYLKKWVSENQPISSGKAP